LAFSLGWIGDEMVWLEMLSARNRMTHTCDASYALEVYDSLPSFLQAFRELLETLEKETLY